MKKWISLAALVLLTIGFSKPLLAVENDAKAPKTKPAVQSEPEDDDISLDQYPPSGDDTEEAAAPAPAVIEAGDEQSDDILLEPATEDEQAEPGEDSINADDTEN